MAFGIKEVLILCGAAGVFAFGHHLQQKERAEIVARHGLADGQPEAYDSCMSAMSRKKLTKGGANKDFCACFAKEATAQLVPAHKKLAGSFLERALDKSDKSLGAEMFTPATYDGLAIASEEVALGIMLATTKCTDVVRTTCPADDQACIERIKSRVARAER